MTFILFVIVSIAVLIFLIYWNITFSRVEKKDAAIFEMAELRSEILTYIRRRKESIGKLDAQNALNLVSACSHVISNHQEIYHISFNFKKIRKAITLSIQEIEENENLLSGIKNKTLKRFYVKFSMILLKNIRSHIKFFDFRLAVVLITALAGLIYKGQLKSLKTWLTRKEGDYKKTAFKLGVE